MPLSHSLPHYGTQISLSNTAAGLGERDAPPAPRLPWHSSRPLLAWFPGTRGTTANCETDGVFCSSTNSHRDEAWLNSHLPTNLLGEWRKGPGISRKPGQDHRSPSLNPWYDPLRLCLIIHKMEILTYALLTSQACCKDQVR